MPENSENPELPAYDDAEQELPPDQFAEIAPTEIPTPTGMVDMDEGFALEVNRMAEVDLEATPDAISVVSYRVEGKPVARIEDLSITRAMWLAIFRPRHTIPALLKVMVDSEAYPADGDADTDSGERHRVSLESPAWVDNLHLTQIFNATHLRRVGWLLLILVPMLHGAGILYEIATNPFEKAKGDIGDADFWVGLSLFIAVVALLFETRERWLYPLLTALGSENFKVAPSPVSVETPLLIEPIVSRKENNDHLNPLERLLEWSLRHSLRLMLILPALVLTYYAYDKAAVTDAQGVIIDVYFTKAAFQSWVGAILCWYIIFLVDLNGLFMQLMGRNIFPVEQWKTTYQKTVRWRWTYTILVLILILAAYFRLHRLDEVPPTMTSDHMEKLINAIEVDNGYHAIFFPNNGGREAFQMYYVKALATWLGMDFDFRTLKYASISEGLLTIALLYVMVKTVIGRTTKERDQLGDWIGLASAGLLAVSSWHIMISRLGLRIGLTPIAVCLATIFLVRAVRFNRRSDFVHLGMVLGFGMYWYQADRMLPFVAIPVVGLAMLLGLTRFKERTWRYGLQFAMTIIMAIVIYLPMHHYSQAFPEKFWSRTYGRLFGDIQSGLMVVDSAGNFVYGYDVDNETGAPIFRGPTRQQIMDQLYEQRGKIVDNYEEAFLMFSWDGDPGWFQNPQGNPALDGTTNAFLMLGVFFWTGYTLWRREVALLVVPLGVVILMLSSTLTISPTLNENPSFTRLSGLIPYTFLLAGFPLGLLGYEIVKAGHTRVVAYLVAVLVVGLFIRRAAPANYDNYFEKYRVSYEVAWKPYEEISIPLRDFAERGGSYGNAFYIHTPHWLDHRILGSMAGDFGWPNTLDTTAYSRDRIYALLQENNGTRYQYDPTKPLLFYIHPKDGDSLEYFQTRFPGGHLEYITARNGNDFYIYTAPAGWGWIGAYITEQTASSACISMCRFIH